MRYPPSVSTLRDHVVRLTKRAQAPFSGQPVGAALLLTDGTWVPGVRVESASFSLTIPALLNAMTTAVAAGRGADVTALVMSRPLRREEIAYVQDLADGPWEGVAEDMWIRPTAQAHDAVSDGVPGDGAPDPMEALPAVGDRLDPFLSEAPADADAGIALARRIAERAYVPNSDFPVGAVLKTADGRWIPGVNVEHPDWARILCAERNALGTMCTYGCTSGGVLYLTCPRDDEGTPCGACRQLLAELTPDATLWMDRHARPPEDASVRALLPGSFRGKALLS